MVFTFSENNAFRNVGIHNLNNELIVMNINSSSDNISFHSTTNDTNVDIMSIKTILNKDTNKDLNISTFDGSHINPVIKINNTEQHVNITSNLNILSNLNVTGNTTLNSTLNVTDATTLNNMVITGLGNVGIGTNNPFQKLVIKGNLNVDQIEVGNILREGVGIGTKKEKFYELVKFYIPAGEDRYVSSPAAIRDSYFSLETQDSDGSINTDRKIENYTDVNNFMGFHGAPSHNIGFKFDDTTNEKFENILNISTNQAGAINLGKINSIIDIDRFSDYGGWAELTNSGVLNGGNWQHPIDFWYDMIRFKVGAYEGTNNYDRVNNTHFSIALRRHTLAFRWSDAPPGTKYNTIGGNLLVMKHNGLIGIGTHDPLANLDVNGTLNVTGATTLGSTINVTGATTLGSTLNVTGATTLGSTLNVTGLGNVGIGTNNPLQKLVIKGNLNADQIEVGNILREGVGIGTEKNKNYELIKFYIPAGEENPATIRNSYFSLETEDNLARGAKIEDYSHVDEFIGYTKNPYHKISFKFSDTVNTPLEELFAVHTTQGGRIGIGTISSIIDIDRFGLDGGGGVFGEQYDPLPGSSVSVAGGYREWQHVSDFWYDMIRFKVGVHANNSIYYPPKTHFSIALRRHTLAFRWSHYLPTNMNQGETIHKSIGDDNPFIKNLLVMKHDGTIGIGTYDPQKKLDVHGDTAVKGNVSIYQSFSHDLSTYDGNEHAYSGEIELSVKGDNNTLKSVRFYLNHYFEGRTYLKGGLNKNDTALVYEFSLDNSTWAPIAKIMLSPNPGSSNIYNAMVNFTGQHRCVPLNIDYYNNVDNYIGYIVYATGNYKTYKYNTEILETKKNAITINDSLPIVELSNKKKQKSIFGVISNKEEEDRTYKAGVFETILSNKNDDKRLYINSLGEGAIWIVNTNGNLENGDYIQSSEVIGHGEKQDDDILHNYTVAKITCDCEFDLNSEDYECVEFEDSTSENTYRKAFVGCTYHCG